MLSSLTATEVAFLQIAVLQAVAALVWGLGAWFVRAERVAIAHWAAYAAMSSSTWFVLARNLDAPPLMGVLVGVCSAIALRRGIRLFIGRAWGWRVPVLLLLLALGAGVLFSEPAWRPAQAVVNFGVLAWLFLGMAGDLQRHARDDLHWRLPSLLALPLLLGALGFASRALRALIWPESVLAEMNVHSALNVGSALGYIVLVLLMHATLMALVVARLVRELQRLAQRDGLTGLLNRRAIEEALDAQMQRSQRSGEVFALMMLDVDHFKAINDRHGHAAGDLALKHVAAVLRAGLREVDRLGRFGGEEFLLMLPGLPIALAQPVAERLREQIAARPVPHAAATITLSVSIGIAEWDGGAGDLDPLLARADAALYRAKAAGRNCVMVELLPQDAGGAAGPRGARVGAGRSETA
jgi:diguanylate cyclase (GGDEF)-like protein